MKWQVTSTSIYTCDPHTQAEGQTPKISLGYTARPMTKYTQTYD